MELTIREMTLIAFALTVVAADGAPVINASSDELLDLSRKIIRGNPVSENNEKYGFGTFPAH